VALLKEHTNGQDSGGLLRVIEFVDLRSSTVLSQIRRIVEISTHSKMGAEVLIKYSMGGEYWKLVLQNYGYNY
jgi:hypothetical protein